MALLQGDAQPSDSGHPAFSRSPPRVLKSHLGRAPSPPLPTFSPFTLITPCRLPRLPFHQSPSGKVVYVYRGSAKTRPAAPRIWTGTRGILHQPSLPPIHLFDPLGGRWAWQRSPRGVSSARSAGILRHGGGSSCLSRGSQAIVELVSRTCSSPSISPKHW